MMPRLPMLPVAVAFAAPAVAHAQPTCGPGQLAVDAAGHCCSPGQTWDSPAGQCANVMPPSTSAPAPAPSPPNAPASPDTITNLVVSHGPLGDPTAPVPVTFAPQQPGDDETLVLQPVVGPAVTCTVPCIVNLAPGYVSISGSGQRTFTTALNVPPLLPLTVQVNHLTSAAPAYVGGSLVLAAGIAATVASIYFIASAASSCGSSAQTAESCDDSNATKIVLGSLLLPLGLTSATLGIVVLALASNSGQHPITLMDPGAVSSRPLTGSGAPSLRLVGVEPIALRGGGLLRGAFEF